MNMFILGIPKVCLKKAVICDTRTIEESRGQRFQHGSTSPVASAGMILSVVDMSDMYVFIVVHAINFIRFTDGLVVPRFSHCCVG